MTLAAALFVGSLLGVAPSPAAVAPQVTALAPCGGRRGTEVVVDVSGQRLLEPQDVLLSRPGLELRKVEPGKAENFRLTFAIPAECPLGAHPFRVRTKFGLSNLVLFQVGTLPEVAAEPRAGAAQTVPLGTTIHGRLGAEDEHRFAIVVDAGASVACEVQATRLGFGPLDLTLAVLAPDGTTVAAADDTGFGGKDPVVRFVAPVAGTYLVRLAPAFAEAGSTGAYRLHVGTFPRPFGVLPCGGAAGAEVELPWIGGAGRIRAKLPEGSGEVLPLWPEDERGIAPTPIFVRVGGPPNLEALRDAKGALRVAWPGSVHGVVGAPASSVSYTFSARRGQELEFRVFARALRSPLDAVLSVRASDGRVLASNDDANGLDPTLRYTPQADAELQLEVRDLLRRGSPEHFFRLEGTLRAAAAPPPATLRMVVNPREEASVVLPRGGSAGALLQTTNLDADAKLALAALGLPPGVTASCGPFVKGSNLVPILLTASAEAPLGAAWLTFATRAPQAAESRPASFVQEVAQVIVRNNQTLLTTAQRALPIAVVEPPPFRLVVAAPQVPAVRGAPLALDVRVERDAGFAEPVRLRALWNPPGVAAGQVVVGPESASTRFVVDASANAQLGTFPYAVLASARWREATFELASGFVAVSFEKPFLGVELGKARTEAGRAVELELAFDVPQPLPEGVRATLIGLPRGASAAPVVVPSGTGKTRHRIEVAPDAQVGRHRGFQLEVCVPRDGGEVVHRFGGGELRVDAPLGVGEPKR